MQQNNHKEHFKVQIIFFLLITEQPILIKMVLLIMKLWFKATEPL